MRNIIRWVEHSYNLRIAFEDYICVVRCGGRTKQREQVKWLNRSQKKKEGWLKNWKSQEWSKVCTYIYNIEFVVLGKN